MGGVRELRVRQVVDTSLVEPLTALLGPQLTAYDLLGWLQPRTGSRSSHNAPRNVYATADGSYVAVSASAETIAARVVRVVGRPGVSDGVRAGFATARPGEERAEHDRAAHRQARPARRGRSARRGLRARDDRLLRCLRPALAARGKLSPSIRAAPSLDELAAA
jgi:crotonobetainyl-CoA:carnitine CoA-transferase CaiB-like acyl-CoA transferase